MVLTSLYITFKLHHVRYQLLSDELLQSRQCRLWRALRVGRTTRDILNTIHCTV